MIVNVCASSISREPVKQYTNYYYETSSERKTSKPSTERKCLSREKAGKPLSVKAKAKKFLQKIRRLIAGRIAKASMKA
uniref:Ovule protein n=1 Tax=Haemonchus contortus TaxID=6289 RepID=A0A7I4Z6C3_HAECO